MAAKDTKIVLTAEDKTKQAFASAANNISVFATRADSINASLGAIARFAGAGGALLGVGAAAAVSTATLAAMAISASNVADKLRDVSLRTGISVESLSGLQVAAENSGTSIDTLARGVKILQVQLADAKQGQGDNIETLRQLGVVGLTANEALYKIADALLAVEDAETRTKIANVAFGKSGQELIPVLLEGGTALRRFVEDAGKSRNITTEFATEVDKLKDNLRIMQANLEGIGATVANAILPYVNDFTDELRTQIKLSDNLFDLITTFGLKNPFADPVKTLARYREELQGLEKDLRNPQLFGIPRVAAETRADELRRQLIPNEEAAVDRKRARQTLDPQTEGLLAQSRSGNFRDSNDRRREQLSRINDPVVNKPEKISKARTLLDELNDSIARTAAESAQLKFVNENFEELSSGSNTLGQSLEYFEAVAGRFKGLPGADKLRDQAISIEDFKRQLDFKKELDSITEESRRLSFVSERMDELGVSALDSAEAIATFDVEAGKFKGVEGANELIVAAAAADKFRKSIEIKTQISDLNSGLDSLLERIVEIERYGEVNPFNDLTRSAQRQISRDPNISQADADALDVNSRKADILKRQESVAEFVAGQQKANQELSFQISLIGLSAKEQERLTEIRKIDLEVQRLSIGASEEERESIRARGEVLKDTLSESLALQERLRTDFSTGWKEAFDDYVEEATNSANKAREVFNTVTSTFKSTVADALTGDFDGIEDRFKTLFANIAADWLTTQAVLTISENFPDAGKSVGSFLGLDSDPPSGGATSAATDALGSSGADASLTSLSTSATSASTGITTFSTSLAGLDTGLTTLSGTSLAVNTSMEPIAAAALQTSGGLKLAGDAAVEFATKLATSSAVGAAGGAAAKGAVISSGNFTAFASGGLVTKPTTFPLRNGKTGLMGESGPEAIMPTKQASNGKLGVRFLRKDGKEDVLPLARDRSGRLAVREFAKGGVIDREEEMVKFALGGVIGRDVIKFESGGVPSIGLPNSSRNTTIINRSHSTGVNVTMNVVAPDPSAFARTKNQMVNELRAAVGSASRRM